MQTPTPPLKIHTINHHPPLQFTIKYNSSTNLPHISKQLHKNIQHLHFPHQTHILFTPHTHLLQSSIHDFLLPFVLPIILIYLLIAAHFQSFKYPFVIIFTLPFILI
ncbi:efflux RND transporter permease subunit, partial [Cytobacillus oceanisediminis]|uniref:efflux RND transporter permease subunit n=1 Tax=Cytobacillus oceanisediminis TaxID=665099 RepID=UPI0037C0C1E2